MRTVGAFGVGASRSWCSPHLPADIAPFWFLMQVGMLTGLVTTDPVDWWLIRRGIKDIMETRGRPVPGLAEAAG